MINFIRNKYKAKCFQKKIAPYIADNNFTKIYQAYLLFLYYNDYRIDSIESDIAQHLTNKKVTNKKDSLLNIGVCGWDLSHNAAGRAITLADSYHYFGYNTQLIGCILQNKSQTKSVWQPISDHTIPCHTVDIRSDKLLDLLPKLIKFVIDKPYDIVHLSKPRITNVVLAILYWHIWGAKVIIDIDDEELAFLKKDGSDIYYSTNIKNDCWTNYAVNFFKNFDNITVSNFALKNKYGGIVIPHLRNEKIFYYSYQSKTDYKKHLGIHQDDIVVLFFGTPKRHKGLLETARAICQLNNPKIVFLIVGDFIEMDLKKQLLSIDNVRYIFLPNQPYHKAQDIVSMGDICILMQDKSSKIAKYQLPAKLIDALAMGLTIFLQKTPATQNLDLQNYVYFVNQDNISQKIAEYLKKDKSSEKKQQQYAYFLNLFSIGAYKSTFKDLTEINTCKIKNNEQSVFDVVSKISKIKNNRQFVKWLEYERINTFGSL